MEHFSFDDIDYKSFESQISMFRNRTEVENARILEVVSGCLSIIANNISYWEDRCEYSKKMYGKSFYMAVTGINNGGNSETIKSIALYMYAFFVECKYWTDDHFFSINDLAYYYTKLIDSCVNSGYSEEMRVLFNNVQTEIFRETVREKLNREDFHRIYNESIRREKILDRVDTL